MKIRKYPRTPHLQGSRLQPGDEDLSQAPQRELVGRYLVVEEKVDGANSAVSFDPSGELLLQSRGHFLSGGSREKHFALFKSWAGCFQADLYEILGSRYIMYGEWLYAKHTIFYDCLPHYFLEFDIYDREAELFLDTARRHAMLAGSPVVSVPVLYRGELKPGQVMADWVGASHYQSKLWLNNLTLAANQAGQNPQRVIGETDRTGLMEGLYLKVEENGQTVDRLKWVRHSFLTTVLDSGTHWLDRPIVANRLADNVALFGC